MIRIDRLMVVVPAHDEADLLPGCLDSIEAALAAPALAGLPTSVVVAADDCTDGTEGIMLRHVGADERLALVRGRWRSAGRARAAATASAMDRIGPVDHRLWILTTDADSVVPPEWIVTQLGLAERGWAAVAGIVRLDEGTADERVRREFTRTYLVAADGCHGHVHGANLGVRGDAYAAIGGWAPIALAEDHATWNRLVAHGYPVVQSTASWVWTSGRLDGRAPGGFADTLTALVA